MTIDEAIKHAREVAEEHRVKNRVCGNCKYCVKGQIHPRQGYCYFNVVHYEHDLSQKACSNWESNDDIGCQCAEEHEQLAEWLELLKWYEQGMEDIPSESGVMPKDIYHTGYDKGRADAIDEILSWLNENQWVEKELLEYLEQLKGEGT